MRMKERTRRRGTTELGIDTRIDAHVERIGGATEEARARRRGFRTWKFGTNTSTDEDAGKTEWRRLGNVARRGSARLSGGGAGAERAIDGVREVFEGVSFDDAHAVAEDAGGRVWWEVDCQYARLPLLSFASTMRTCLRRTTGTHFYRHLRRTRSP